VPIIALTALGQDAPDVAKHAVNALLSKPTSSRELIDTVHKLLGGRIVGAIG
jgi:CheY-like chemotaxis protein